MSGQQRHSLAAGGATTFAVVLGNALEWYEVVIYGYLAAVIARLFFPTTDAGTSLLLTFASFGLSYLSRPLGALVLGLYADRFGRKTALQLSIWLMVGASAVIALTPTYQSIGLAAPVIVVVARLVQGCFERRRQEQIARIRTDGERLLPHVPHVHHEARESKPIPRARSTNKD